MTHLVELARRKPQPWSTAEVDYPASTDLHVQTLIAVLDERAELIDREEVLHSIAKLPGDVARVVGEGLRRVLRLPTAVLVLKRLRQIPVILRGERLDTGGLHLVDQAAVEVDPLRVGLTHAVRKDTRPRNGEPIRVGAGVLHQRHILLVAVVVVVGDVAGVVVLYVPGLCVYVSQIEGPLPSSFHALSIW
jgi:hypothetical protein